MKKIFILLTSIMLLSGCVETIALLGPASSVIGGGNVVHSSISSAASYGVKKTTGKTPMQHALAFAEEKNPNKNKDRCISFVKQKETETKKGIEKKIKGKKVKIKKIKTKEEIQLRSIEAMLVESAMSKKQISHLKVSIEKNYKIKD